MFCLREACLKRDDYTCLCCEQRGGHVHVAIGPFFHWKNEVREQPTVYEYRINVKSRRKFRIDPDSRGQRLWLSKSNRRLLNTAWENRMKKPGLHLSSKRKTTWF